MLRCVKCNRFYENENQRFCLVDNGRLVSVTEPATVGSASGNRISAAAVTVAGNAVSANRARRTPPGELTREIVIEPFDRPPSPPPPGNEAETTVPNSEQSLKLRRANRTREFSDDQRTALKPIRKVASPTLDDENRPPVVVEPPRTKKIGSDKTFIGLVVLGALLFLTGLAFTVIYLARDPQASDNAAVVVTAATPKPNAFNSSNNVVNPNFNASVETNQNDLNDAVSSGGSSPVNNPGDAVSTDPTSTGSANPNKSSSDRASKSRDEVESANGESSFNASPQIDNRVENRYIIRRNLNDPNNQNVRNGQYDLKTAPTSLGAANSVDFENQKDNLSSKLAQRFIGFALKYPTTWQRNQPPQSVETPNFLDISRRNTNSTLPVEQLLISWSDSNGTTAADRSIFPVLARKLREKFAREIPKFRLVSEGETRLNDLDGYEVLFEGETQNQSGAPVKIWGRTVFLPTNQPGTRTGLTLTMLATSLATELSGARDVGAKGDLADILQTLRLQN